MTFARLLVVAFVASFGSVVARAAAPTADKAESFVYRQSGHAVTVRYFAPAGTADRPVLFVFHGLDRDGRGSFEDWAATAERKHFVLIVPEFSREEFPGVEGYNYGNSVDREGRLRPREEWAFSMIEPIFDAVRQRVGNHRSDYLVYGFSAGAQFVQRFLYLVPEAHVSRAVVASAGWYTLADLTGPFPYGLKGTPAGEGALRAALAKPVVVLVGDADTESDGKLPRHTSEADQQGPHRLARAQFYYRHSRAAAAALGVACPWSLVLAPGVAHAQRKMVPFALPCLLPESPSSTNATP